MAFLSGTTGFVSVGAAVFAFDKWRLSIKSGAPKTTNFTGAGFQTNVAGVVGGSLSLSGPYDRGAMPFAANAVYNFTLGMDAGVSIVVPARVTGIDVDNSVEDAPRVSLTAESTGTFTAAIV